MTSRRLLDRGLARAKVEVAASICRGAPLSFQDGSFLWMDARAMHRFRSSGHAYKFATRSAALNVCPEGPIATRPALLLRPNSRLSSIANSPAVATGFLVWFRPVELRTSSLDTGLGTCFPLASLG